MSVFGIPYVFRLFNDISLNNDISYNFNYYYIVVIVIDSYFVVSYVYYNCDSSYVYY